MIDISDTNWDDIEPRTYDCLPAGEYLARIEESERKPCSTGNGDLLKIKLVIVDGPYKNRPIYDTINLWNTSTKSREIAEQTMRSIMDAVGIKRPKRVEELHGIPMVIRVTIEERNDKPGEHSNKIKGYKPRAPVAAPPPAAPTQAPTTTDAPKQAPWARK